MGRLCSSTKWVLQISIQDGFDRAAHPHIGLETVTFLIDGEITHRDNRGNMQTIRPGEVNWMVAGSGIVHSERTPPDLRASGSNLFGIQAWIALPCRHEEVTADFAHYGAPEIPRTYDTGVEFTLIAGACRGRHISGLMQLMQLMQCSGLQRG